MQSAAPPGSADGNKLVEVLAEQLGDRTLGDDSITTGLCIITKRADTRSTWPLLNHPSGKFYEANRDIPLTTAIRASTAAPFFNRSNVFVRLDSAVEK